MKTLSGKTILVTGGAGFIGSALTERLLADGNQVRCLDNFSTGKRENIASFLSEKNYQLIEGDIRSAETCRKAAEGADLIFHEAALGSVPRSIRDPLTTIDVNISGTANVFYAAIQAGVRRVVYAASSSVYGDDPTLPKREARVGHPLSPYALTKRVDEMLAENFHRVYGLDCIGLRYFNVFGRRQDPDGAYAAVIPKFASALIAGKSPVINGDGSFSRDFTYIDNVVEANLLAALSEQDLPGDAVFNIAGGGRMTLLELFSTLRDALSVRNPAIGKIEPEFGPERKGDIPHSLADISKAERVLGYHPLFTAEAGLRKTAEWYFRTCR